MSTAELFEETQAVFRVVFEDDALTIARETTAQDVPGWDSFAHVNLIVAIETRFGITFRMSEAQEFNCVGDMIDAIGQKVGVSE